MLALRVYDGSDDEAGWIARAAAGDRAAADWLVERWTPAIWRFCLRMLHNEADAHDATQETLLKALRHLHTYDPQRSWTTWMFGIARNTCIDEHRRRGRRPTDPWSEAVDPNASPANDLAAAEQSRLLDAALQDLPPMYREILILYHFEHLKYHEIAEALDLPLGTVMNRIFRARHKLRAAFESRGGEL